MCALSLYNVVIAIVYPFILFIMFSVCALLIYPVVIACFCSLFILLSSYPFILLSFHSVCARPTICSQAVFSCICARCAGLQNDTAKLQLKMVVVKLLSATPPSFCQITIIITIITIITITFYSITISF